MMWLQLILYNRAVVSSKLGMDHYSLADLFKATNLYVSAASHRQT